MTTDLTDDERFAVLAALAWRVNRWERTAAKRLRQGRHEEAALLANMIATLVEARRKIGGVDGS